MITHRLATMPPEPPVRFYKLIAISFLALTIALFGVVIFVTSKKAEIAVIAKADSAQVKASITVGPAAELKGAATSTEFSWSQVYHPSGDTQVDGLAEGTVTIYNITAAPQPLVKTTRLLTAEGVLFRLSRGVVVPAKGEVEAAVYADQPGVGGNIKPSAFTIPGLAADKQKLIYAKSKEPMTGGIRSSKVLSEEDLTAAANDFKAKAKDAYLKANPPGDAGAGEARFLAVSEGKTSADHKAGEEVSAFTLTGTVTVVKISYRSDDLAQLLAKEIAKKIDTGSEKLLSADKQPQLALAQADLKNQTADLMVTQNIVVTLDANAEKLLPQNFVGKRKDEIERYLMGLEHVSGVEVIFSPSWMLSAPKSADHIKVVVKNIE